MTEVGLVYVKTETDIWLQKNSVVESVFNTSVVTSCLKEVVFAKAMHCKHAVSPAWNLAERLCQQVAAQHCCGVTRRGSMS